MAKKPPLRILMSLTFAYIFSAINITAMLTNFLLGGKLRLGRYPAVFIITKLLLVPSIFLIYCLIANDINWKVASFAFFGWLGDALILIDKFALLFLGAVSFSISHLSINSFFDINWSMVKPIAMAIILPISITYLLFFLPKFHYKKPKDFFAAAYFSLIVYNCKCTLLRSYMYYVFHPSFLM